MSENNPQNINPEGTSGEQAVELEGGTYEILKNRLSKQGDDLRDRLNKLNDERKKAFGSIDTKIITTERIATDNNCVPWDMIALKEVILFGYNVQFGLKAKTEVADVISVYQYQDQKYTQVELDALKDPSFLNDFDNLYKYYKHTQFVKFSKIGTFLYMVFRIGKAPDDIKTFKWLINEGTIEYQDARSDHEFKFPKQIEFAWTKTTRDMHQSGDHPHVSIEDEVFIESIGGDITIKVENNTATGKGVYSEPVDSVDQTLDDAEISYARVGNLFLFKVLPFQEKHYRYIVFNKKTQKAQRIDAIAESCIMLPDDQGIIFSTGYCLQSGEFKIIDHNLDNIQFERKIVSPNGEDFMFVFYNLEFGRYLLLSYNIIDQTVKTPITCNGFSAFENGELAFFKEDPEPKKLHQIQIWQTPFTHADFLFETDEENYLQKIGNKEIVQAMAGCHELLNLINKDDSYAGLYHDLLKGANDVLDGYFWLDQKETFELATPINDIKTTSKTAIDEFEKVVQIRKNTEQQFEAIEERVNELIAKVKRTRQKSVNEFVDDLAAFRVLRGEVISLKELRYVDLLAVDGFESQLAEQSEKLSQSCVNFLVKPDALDHYKNQITEIEQAIEETKKVVEANKVDESINERAKALELLIDVVSNLKIEDATQTTAIIDQISAIYSQYNTLRSSLKKKRKELLSVEGKAEFSAQMNLIGQGLINYLDLCDTVAKCEEYLSKLMVQLEELEGKFADFEEYLEKISIKREEIYNAFDGRKIEIKETLDKKTSSLYQSAERIVKAVKNRLLQLDDVSEINGYMASDLMVEKARNLIAQLLELGDSIKADDIQSKLNAAKDEALRQLKDKKELFAADGNAIAFGNYNFLVNDQSVGVSMIERGDQMFYHITGTNFFEFVDDSIINDNKTLWNQSVVSESPQVYRAEYLAYLIFAESLTYKQDNEEQKEFTEHTLNTFSEKQLLAFVQEKMSVRYNEGYVKGIHDQDATKILMNLVQLHLDASRLRFSSSARALAAIYWTLYAENKEELESQLKGAGTILGVFPDSTAFDGLKSELNDQLMHFVEQTELFGPDLVEEAAEYLFEDVATHGSFVIEGTAIDGFDEFNSYLKGKKALTPFQSSISSLDSSVSRKLSLIRSWLNSWVVEFPKFEEFVDEIAYILLTQKPNAKDVVRVSTEKEVQGMNGSHRLIDEGVYNLNYRTFSVKMKNYIREEVPKYLEFREHKQQLLKDFEEDLRLDEFKPRVMGGFVRNQLIDKVYLPLIGANLAKQIGAAGEDKRTDLMGMLLLISPPGYGKTTLMEYIASRLGVIFMKINGPAIGHEVTSVDPQQAGNAGAREELEKLNLAFEMGDNVMIYLDDIQHCNPEFLQKFISLCDAQRKIEGVYKGKAKTYDFRGKKVAVIMAGNPYTESGEKFQIPDMLANRADIYNLGDIIGDSADSFELSYIENSTSSNAVLQKIAARDRGDFLKLIKAARNGDMAGMDLDGNHSPEEISECVTLLQKVLEVQKLVLDVNMQYIDSAGQSDIYRTEPSFKLQGSYRNMNKIVERLSPIMNEQELETLMLSHYENESQTLTTGAEANMLKFKELFGVLSEEDAKRWEDIKQLFVKNNKSKHSDGVDLTGLESHLETLNTGLNGIRGALARSADGVTNQLLMEVLKKLEENQKALMDKGKSK